MYPLYSVIVLHNLGSAKNKHESIIIHLHFYSIPRHRMPTPLKCEWQLLYQMGFLPHLGKLWVGPRSQKSPWKTSKHIWVLEHRTVLPLSQCILSGQQYMKFKVTAVFKTSQNTKSICMPPITYQFGIFF